MRQISGPSLADMLAHDAASAPASVQVQPAGQRGDPLGDAQQDTLSDLLGEIHEHQVPAFAAEALDRLHGSLYASYRHLQLCESERLLPHTWIAYRRGEIISVLLFRVEAKRVLVLTEMFLLDEPVARAFCRDVFARYARPRVIVFNAIRLQSPPATLPCQHYVFSENYVLTLRPSVDAYEQALGKSTRKTLRGYGNRLLRDHPNFSWRSCSSQELSRAAQREIVRQLQAFKRASMAERGKQATSDRRETARLLRMAFECGRYSIGTLEGKLCAGSLACRIGDTCVMLLCAADPAFSSYRLGMLACYWSICDCLQQGARQCHLLWGRYRYKEQLLAVPEPLHQLTIYRSYGQMLCSPVSVLRVTMRGLRHRLRAELVNVWPAWRDALPRPLRASTDVLRQRRFAKQEASAGRRRSNFLQGILSSRN